MFLMRSERYSPQVPESATSAGAMAVSHACCEREVTKTMTSSNCMVEQLHRLSSSREVGRSEVI